MYQAPCEFDLYPLTSLCSAGKSLWGSLGGGGVVASENWEVFLEPFPWDVSGTIEL